MLSLNKVSEKLYLEEFGAELKLRINLEKNTLDFMLNKNVSQNLSLLLFQILLDLFTKFNSST